MIYRILPVLFFSILTGCFSSPADKPLWINKSESICIQRDSLKFEATGEDWQAGLYSFTQPVPLTIKFTGNGFILSAINQYGITEGTATLILLNKKQKFFYNLKLHNEASGAVTYADLRSPKTVNPDSSLMQHRMIHSIDEWRNIVQQPASANPFFEEMIRLKPISGTFRAQKDKALSAFYVQPGSATAIPLRSAYNQAEKCFKVTAGPLKDKHNNQVSNGTIVAFIYNDIQYSYRMESALVNGIASVKIPCEKNKQYRLLAKVDKTVSEQIILQR